MNQRNPIEKKINVLIVADDFAVVSQAASKLLAKGRRIHVIAAVADPIFAMQRMPMKWSDVVVLKVETPRMDGIAFLQMVMQECPSPVVICSTLRAKGADTAMQGLAVGAVSSVAKPKTSFRGFLLNAIDMVREVKAVARAFTQ
jgi:two-component system, chemotaxis family, protein-glutamate methylesterase/glutaminase